MRKLLITGASGFMGQYLIHRLCDRPRYELSGTYRTRIPPNEGCRWYPIELTNRELVDQLFRLVRPDVVVHLRAISNIEAIEEEPHRATEVHVKGTQHITRNCADYVFPGDRGLYREDETPSPVVHYGKTKWKVEQSLPTGAS